MYVATDKYSFPLKWIYPTAPVLWCQKKIKTQFYYSNITQPFISMIIEKICEKIISKVFFDHNLRLIFEIFEKKKCDFMCYTWYETIQQRHHWHCCWWQKTLDPRLVLQKISQYCPETRNLRVSTVRYTASSWRHIKFSKICLLFCFSTGSKYYDPNFWLLWKFILRHNSLKKLL